MRSIGEKFSAQPATGTGSLSVPLPISPGRAGFQPALALQYDSGAGNGVLGLGWQLGLPTITRKTDRGLPRYLDDDESDVFVLAGAEDLVPVLDEAGLLMPAQAIRVAGHAYRVRRYRPRTEGLSAWIERWVSAEDRAECFWRVLDRHNLTQWFGRSADSRVADPADPTRVFQWLPSETHDDKGQTMVFGYVADDDAAVDAGATWETHRTPASRSAQRYLKRVCYGNRTPHQEPLHPEHAAPEPPQDWMFELVFDFGDHNADDPRPQADQPWPQRPDPFSDYRAGFERRTARRIERVLMFHHFPEVPAVGADALIRSLLLRYAAISAPDEPAQPGYSQITAIEAWAHERAADGRLVSRQTPPLEFRYSAPRIDPTVRTLAAADLPGLPVGTQGPGYQWVDLDGEGLSGVLTEDAGAWRYAANLGAGRFAPSRVVAATPARRALGAGQRLMDLNGNGAIDVVELDGPLPGFYERDDASGWKQFIPFAALPRIRWDDPNLRFLDLSGDGHADALVTEDEVFTCYPSLAEQGFGSAITLRPPPGEDGTRLVFADGTQTLFLADMSGDGLTDIVRIRHHEVCYWPNLGHGRFGHKVQMGHAPRFDHEDQFDPRRIRLADIDGSGPTDIVYLGRGGAQLAFNRAGNRFSSVQHIDFPLATHNLDAVQVVDLLGRGTACLVWNSHLPADAETPVRYIDLMSGGKPHLLVASRNNLGGSTEIDYTPSTHFYVADQAAGTPWITRLPFPVQCVSRVTVRDQWRGTAFSSSYSYHHGHFDGTEREFRGFGRVEQVDIEDYGRFSQANTANPWITDDQRLFQPPVKTVTWYHTGLAEGRGQVLAQFAGEYFPARYAIEGGFAERSLPEPTLDPGLGTHEWREALRACKGMVLRQEVYELSAASLAPTATRHLPVRLYSAATHNCRIQRLQARGLNPHAVFMVTPSEAITYQYEQPLPDPGQAVRPDPRIAHQLTLRVDAYGQALQTVAVGYRRIGPFDDARLDPATQRRIHEVQAETHLAYAEARFTHDVLMRASPAGDAALRHHRLCLPCEARSHELTGIRPADGFYYRPEDFAALRLSDHYPPLDAALDAVDVTPLAYHQQAREGAPQRRLVDHVRTLYFDDAADAQAPASPLPWGQHGPRGLKYEDEQLALTPALLDAIFRAPASLPGMPADLLAWELHPGVTARSLLDDPRRSGYRIEADTGAYWRRSGIAGFAADAAAHFYLPERYTDPFGATTTLDYDPLDLYARSITDARGNRSDVLRFDHRAMAPLEMVDPNGNHTQVCLDLLGRVVAMAAKGKPVADGWQGDDLAALNADDTLRNPGPGEVQAFCTATALDEAQARRWLARAGSRFVYHFGEARDAAGQVTAWATRPAIACGIVREIHATQPGGSDSPLQIALQCSDGGGNVLMAKQQAEPEADGGPLRWIVNGLTVLNNKGKPVKQYEPCFSDLFGCEMPREEGVTPILSYDAAGRVARTDAPDGTFSRVEFSPWHTLQFDAGDTVLHSAWYAERGSPDPTTPLPRNAAGQVTAEPDIRAAWLAAKIADTPAQTHLDSLGRAVIAVAHQRAPDAAARPLQDWSVSEWGWQDAFHATHTRLDTEGKPLWVRDARGNLVMQYLHPPKPNDDPSDELPATSVPSYDIAGNLLFQHSMDAGDRWVLADAAGQPLLAWDLNDVLDADGAKHPEGRLAHTEHDALHRPVRQWLRLGTAAAAVVERFDYRDSADAADGVDLDAARERNLIGQAIVHDDPSGRFELLRLGFTGQVQHEQRRLARHTTARQIDWQGDDATRVAQLETETFTRLTEHDALGRMVRLFNWHRSTERVAVYRPHYNARGVLQSEDLTIGAQLRADGPVGGKTWTAVHGIAYNAKGQRTRLRHGNGTETLYAYDPRSFRLTQIRTTRPGVALPFPSYRSQLRDERVLQQLQYHYDAAGQITEIEDEAWAPAFFRNQAVESRSLYVYDAIGRLIEATGRESALLSGAPTALSEGFMVDGFPADHVLRNYMQRYRYDSVGNFEAMQHLANGGSWTREYATAGDSNRLLRTWVGGDESAAERYDYDVHGSMLNLMNVPASARIRWDWRDMIEGMDLGGGGRAWYAYDAGKQRTRKRIERLGSAVEERLHLGGAEFYRRYSAAGALVEEIETQHLFMDEMRVLLVDEVIVTDNPVLGTGVLVRYQHANHLGSVVLELDETAHTIGNEEFHPYGTTAFRTFSRQIKATSKRYGHSGVERETESGLANHGVRKYSPLLARWTSTDPVLISGGINPFQFSAANPIDLIDLTGMQPSPPAATMRADLSSPDAVTARLHRDQMRLARALGALSGHLHFLLEQFESGGEDYRPRSERSRTMLPPGTGAWSDAEPHTADTTTDFEREMDQALSSGLIEPTESGFAVALDHDASLLSLMDIEGFSGSYVAARASRFGSDREHALAMDVLEVATLALDLVTLGEMAIASGAAGAAFDVTRRLASRLFFLAEAPATRRLLYEYAYRGFTGTAAGHRTVAGGFVVRVGSPYGEFAEAWFASRAEAEARARTLADLGEEPIRDMFALPSGGWPSSTPGVSAASASPVLEVTVYEMPTGTRYLEGIVAPVPEPPPSVLVRPGGGSQMSFVGSSESLGSPLVRVTSFPVAR